MKRRTKSNARATAIATIAALISTPMVHADSFGGGANTFTMDFVDIGNAGNSNDGGDGAPSSTNYGGVSYIFRMGVHEVSEAMIDAYNANSGGPTITKDSRGADRPATSVSWNEAARFVNWLNTSTGGVAAYKVAGEANTNIQLWTPGEAGYDESNPFRNSNATYVLPSEDEWYKAAYYDPNTNTYNDYATGSDTAPTAVASGTTSGTAVYDGQARAANITNAGGLSPYGTMAQNGNVYELIESTWTGTDISASEDRVVRGGRWGSSYNFLQSQIRNGGSGPMYEDISLGFRVAVIPGSIASFLRISDASETLSYGTASHGFIVNSDSAWRWSKNASWITTSEETVQSGKRWFSYTATANPTGAERTATITFIKGDFRVYHKVTQEAGTSFLRIADSSETLSSGNTSHGFFVNSDSAWRWSKNVSWITTSEDTVQSGKRWFSYAASANPTGAKRYATITFIKGEMRVYHKVTQEAGSSFLRIADVSKTLSSGNTSHGFIVNSDSAWRWSENASWITTSEKEVQYGKQWFSYAASANTTSAKRYATITFIKGDFRVYHKITQEAGSSAMLLAARSSSSSELQDGSQEPNNPDLVFDTLSSGEYSGILATEDGLRTLGQIDNIKVSENGVFSAKIFFKKETAAVKGQFNQDGCFKGTIELHDATLVTLEMEIQKGELGGYQILGTAIIDSEVAYLTAVKSGLTPELEGTYSFDLKVEGEGHQEASTANSGIITVSGAGVAQISGVLADGSAWTAVCKLTPEGVMPLYTELYSDAGSLAGIVHFRSIVGTSDFDGTLCLTTQEEDKVTVGSYELIGSRVSGEE